jgi:HK97 family phage major capsid protein
MDQPVGSPLLGRPGAPEEKKGRASSKYEQAFITALRSNFKKVSDVLEEGTDGNGGYLVPEEWDARLIEALEGENIMRRLATVIPTTGEHKIPVVATKPAAAWIDEGEALTWSNDPTFGQKILDAHKLHVAVKITEELLYDNAYNLSGRLPVMFADALGNAEEEAFLTGNGSGKPTGVFDATNGGTASASVAAASLTADNIIDLSGLTRLNSVGEWLFSESNGSNAATYLCNTFEGRVVLPKNLKTISTGSFANLKKATGLSISATTPSQSLL